MRLMPSLPQSNGAQPAVSDRFKINDRLVVTIVTSLGLLLVGDSHPGCWFILQELIVGEK